MADRAIKVVLRADATQAIQEAKKLAASFTDLSKQSEVSVGRAGKAWEIGGQQQAAAAKKAAEEQKRAAAEAAAAQEKAAQKTKDAWNTTGTALTAVGGAWTAFNVAVAKTGIEYNTLQQTSRAALRSILGDAEAVNKQMAELDEFAKTSPFSKATFITAQQQMLAFGIEADKVVGYLSAINDATAAAGGNNETLAELSFIMAQISAAGKITAQDLMQFGQRGVNAAELIGSQMGKTGAQIRDDITKGALDANDALDALAAGMSERFEGASANVKDTMGGALDRVSAAWRDLSASIMSSAVSPDGGGWLVDLTNQFADFLRGIDSMSDSTKQVAGIVSGVGGAATLAAGGFVLMAPRVVETWDALSTLATRAPRATAALGRVGKAAGVTAAALLGFEIATTVVGKFIDQRQGLENVAGAVERLAEAGGSLEDLNLALPQRELAGLKISADDLAGAYEQIQFYSQGMMTDGILNNLFQGAMDMTGLKTAETEARDIFRSIDESLRSLDGDAAAAAFEKIREGMEGVSDVELMHLFPEYAAAIRTELRGLTDELGPMAASAANVAAVMRGDLPDGLVWTAEGLMTVAQAAEAGIDPMTGLAVVMDEVKYKTVDFSDGTRELEEGFASWVEAVGQSVSSFVDLASAYEDAGGAGDDWIAKLDEQIAAQQEWQANMSTLAGRVSSDLLGYLADLGPAGAAMVKDLANMTSAELAEMEERFRLSGQVAGNDWAAELAAQEAVFAAVGAEMGDAAMREAQEKVRSGGATLADIVADYDLKFDLDADGNPALEEALRVARQIENIRATLRVTTIVSGVPTVNSVRGGGYRIDSADGNIVDYYANGGLRENHVAQIAPAGAWRIWAEPETGGEAYIPLAPQKRARSLDIWQETGRRLGVQGFADGGMYAPSFQLSPGSTSTTYGDNIIHAHFPNARSESQIERALMSVHQRMQQRGGR